MELSYCVMFGEEYERKKVQNALRIYPVVQEDETIAYRVGQLLARADMNAGGESGVDKSDPMIAADLYDEAVLTANVEDFEALGVPVDPY